MTFHWLTTKPNPRVPATGPDAGQRGWKLHAVYARDDAKFSDVQGRPSLCGIYPTHGWDLDLFIEDKCKRCIATIKKAGLPVK